MMTENESEPAVSVAIVSSKKSRDFLMILNFRDVQHSIQVVLTKRDLLDYAEGFNKAAETLNGFLQSRLRGRG